MTRPASVTEEAPSGLWTREFVYTLLSTFGIFLGYQTLLVLVPLRMADGGAGSLAIGLGTGVFMFTAAVAQLSTPRMLLRYRIRTLLLASLLLLGLPSFLEAMTASPAVTVGLNVLRGVGIGFGSVASSTGVSLLAPPARRGEALGLFGLTTAVPSMVGPPVALAILRTSSFPAIFVALGALTLLACGAAGPVATPASPASETGGGLWQVVRRQEMFLPFAVFAALTAVYGAILSFGPLYVLEERLTAASLFVFLVGSAFAASRLYGGLVADRIGSFPVVLVGLSSGVLSLLLLSFVPFPHAALVS